MIVIQKNFAAIFLVAALSIPAIANAALVGRDLDGNLTTAEAYYDDIAGLTWLADANYAQTSGYDADGRMNWTGANNWVASLDIDGVLGADGWRLPETLQTDASCSQQSANDESYGYNCTGSEMGNLFYNVLGNSYTSTESNSSDPFSNIMSNFYWSSTEHATYDAYAWLFKNYDGEQAYASKSSGSYYAWAVHDGSIGASVVPVPSAVWLFGSGLLGLIGIAKRKKA